MLFSVPVCVSPFHELLLYFASFPSPVAVHPANVYPAFVGAGTVISSLYAPVVGVFSANVPPFNE